MTKIEKKIVGFSVIKPGDEAPAAKPATVLQERPEVLQGCTYKLKTPLSEHALYITINDLDNRPFEIFVNSKAMEHFQWVVALTRVMSAVFRHGGEVAFLVEELMSVMDPKGGYFYRGQYRASLVAEIGSILRDHLTGLGLYQVDNSLAEAAREMIAEKKAALNDAQDDGYPKEATLCDKCQHRALVLMDGCLTCLNCAASKCG